MTLSNLARRKVYVMGSRPDLQVPFQAVDLHDSPGGIANPPLRLYDTSGPGSDPTVGLLGLRHEWITSRNDTEIVDARRPTLRDDGRAAVRSGAPGESWQGRAHPVRRACPGRTVTQLHYARRGEITPEMEFVAIREGLDAEFVRGRGGPAAGPSSPPTSTTPSPSRWPSAATSW